MNLHREAKRRSGRRNLLCLLLSAILLAGLSAPCLAAGPEETDWALEVRYENAGLFDIYYSPESYYCAPAVRDLDGDGRMELVFASYGVTVLDAATGEVRWQVNAGLDRSSGFRKDANSLGRTVSDIAIDDLDGDGRLDIAVGTVKGRVSVLDCEGYFLPGWPQTITVHQKDGYGDIQPPVSSLRIAVLGKGERPSVLAGVGGYAGENLYVYHSDGRIRDGWPQLSPAQDGSVTHDFDTTGYAMGMLADGLSVGDIDGDGEPEILAPSDVQYLCAYHTDGTLVRADDCFGARRPEQNRGGTWGGVALFEDADMELENPNRGWLWFQGNPYVEYIDDRQHLFSAQTGFSGTVVKDLDGDGAGEVICSALMLRADDLNDYRTSQYMTVYVLRGDRTRYVNAGQGQDWRVIPSAAKPYLGQPGSCDTLGGPLENSEAYSGSKDFCLHNYVRSNPVVEDIDCDGVWDILFSSYDGKLHAFSLDDSTTEKAGFPFVLPQTKPGSVYEYASVPVCRDLNGDGTPEIAFASHTSNLEKGLAYDTGVSGRLYILDSAGRELVSAALPGGYILYETQAPVNANQSFAAPAVADIDGDGQDEIVLNTRFGAACAFEVTQTRRLWKENPFPDLTLTDGSEWYYYHVKTAYEQGLMNGKGSGFDPSGTLTLAEAVTMACRLRGDAMDLSGEGPWYAPYVRHAEANGILLAGEFGALEDYNRPATRAEMAYLFANALPGALQPRRSVDSLPDVREETERGAQIFALYRAGVLAGSDASGAFRPDDSILRREAAVLLVRAHCPEYRLGQ